MNSATQSTSSESPNASMRMSLRSQADASADKLGLPNPVEVVEIGCTMVFIKKPDRIVVHWDGFFFDAVRQHK